MDTLSSSVSTLKVPALLHSALREFHPFKTPHTTHQLSHHLTTTKPTTSVSNKSTNFPQTSSSFKNLNPPLFLTPQNSSIGSSPSTHRNPASGYAAALLDIAQCNNSLEVVYRDVQRLAKLFHHEQIQAVLMNPFIGEEEKGRVVKEVAKKGKFNRFLVGLLKMLVEKNRLMMVGEVLMEFERIYDEMSGTRVVMVSSRKKMKEEELLGIAYRVQKVSGAMKVKSKTHRPPLAVAAILSTMLRCTKSYYDHHTTATVLLSIATSRPFCSGNPITPDLLESYTVTPPIKPWPKRLHPRRLVSMITRQQNLDLALQIFDYAGKYHRGFSHNYDTYHSIIYKLSRARAFDTVESLLSRLKNSPEINCAENVLIDVIRSYGLASKPSLAFKTFLRIQKDFALQPSVRALNTLLNAFVQNKRYDLVHSVFKNCKKEYGVAPNIFTFNVLIKGLCKKGDVEGAGKVFDEMPKMGMIPNVVTYTTILGGYASRGDMVSAKNVFRDLFDRGWLPDATTYTVLMDGYCRQGRLDEAIKVMDDMEENGVEPNEVTYGVMVEAFCKEKKAGEALNMLVDMLEKKYVPSPALCCKVIDVLCEVGKVEDACELWRRMLNKNCMPDNAIMSTLIHWLCKEGKVKEARKLFDEFEQGTIPSRLTYNTLIAGMCERGELTEAARLWDDMVEKRCKPNAFTYNMLIKGFSRAGNVKEGVRILEEMLDEGCLPNKSTYMLLIDALRESGMEGEVDAIVSMAIRKGGVDSDS
ncbi:hypothetical protein Tsubulata_014920, partial [Turnera subulata]